MSHPQISLELMRSRQRELREDAPYPIAGEQRSAGARGHGHTRVRATLRAAGTLRLRNQ